MTSPSRDLSTGLLRLGRLSLWFEPRDLWIGLYVAHGAVYACLVPCLPLRWERRGQRRTTPDNAEQAAEWMPGQWTGPG